VTSPIRADTADRLLHEVATVQAESRQPSLVAGVVRDGQLVWSAARGTATGGPEPGPDLQYRIGSITKTVTALLVMQSRDDGLLDLDAPVSSVLGDVPFGSTPIRALLSHAGGLPAEPAGEWWERRDGGDFTALRSQIGEQTPVLPAGRQKHYSNLGYALLGAAVSQLRGRTWIDVAYERVFAPLGMTRTTYAPQPPHAQGYSVHPWSGRLDPEPHTDTGAMAPAGQLWSTVADLARYLAFWLEPDPAVLRPESVAEMRIPAAGTPETGLEAGYGLGLGLTARPGRAMFGHGGSMPGFLAGMAADPQDRTAAVALANATFGDTPVLCETLLDIVAEYEPRPPAEWHPEPELAEAEELLGLWFWGNTPMPLVARNGYLTLDAAVASRRSRFVRAGPDTWRGLDAYFTGETLTVQRAPDGGVDRLDLATYELTRTPYGQ